MSRIKYPINMNGHQLLVLKLFYDALFNGSEIGLRDVEFVFFLLYTLLTSKASLHILIDVDSRSNQIMIDSDHVIKSAGVKTRDSCQYFLMSGELLTRTLTLKSKKKS
uniref:Uncharacterized protein n=1 Tax=Rhizophagus irregularis (strain DAOM 181602 / DAOM 197198 / MUCL 43194) TaxID=747089 RepID=U9T4B9_RHIID